MIAAGTLPDLPRTDDPLPEEGISGRVTRSSAGDGREVWHEHGDRLKGARRGLPDDELQEVGRDRDLPDPGICVRLSGCPSLSWS